MAHRLVTLILAGVFTLPASSAAECGWVLWQRTAQLERNIQWSIVGAATNLAGCETLLKRRMNAAMAQNATLRPFPFGPLEHTIGPWDERSQTFLVGGDRPPVQGWICLPATINDPRPKTEMP